MKNLAILVFGLGLAACGGKSTPATTSPTGAGGGGGAAAGNDNAALATRGGQVYGEHCAKCHGDAGQGGDKAPPVVGKDALPLDPRPGAKRDVQFHTAGDVLGWVEKHMPGDAPGTLPADDYLAVLAFDLQANGVDVSKQPPLTAESAASIVLHP